MDLMKLGRGSIRANINFGGDTDNFEEVCCWKASVKRCDSGPGFMFTSISDIHEHTKLCFMGCEYKHRKHIKLISECKDPNK